MSTTDSIIQRNASVTSVSATHMSFESGADLLISKLFFSGSPTTVGRLIVAIGIWKTIYRMMLAWSRSHVGEERFKTLTPAITDFYTLGAIKRVRDAIDVFAPLFHSVPDLIFGRGSTSALRRNGHTVSGVRAFCCFDFPTPAT